MMRFLFFSFIFLFTFEISAESQLNLHGFFETVLGYRLDNSSYNTDESIMEARLQLDYLKNFSDMDLRVRSDILYDDLWENSHINLNEGKGWIDLREANIMLYPFQFMDLKLGRQILTWGTGDQIFINDLFPKDWNSFFLGRDDEYLKSPSDAIRTSIFNEIINIDIIYVPSFNSDRFIDGSRISYYNSFLGSISGQNAVIEVEKPDKIFNDSELAIRLYKNLSGIEAAFYFYNGFWKSPQGVNPYSGKAFFPELSVYGSSIRGSIFKGIGSFEIGYYNSKEDKDGSNPFIKNSEYRVLLGYEQEITTDFNITIQYYSEIMKDYDEYKRTIVNNSTLNDEYRHLYTLRLTKLALNQNLTLSYFIFYSPSDEDWFMRPKIKYKLNDNFTIELGGNIFEGKEIYTFFGQFDDNDNAYLRIRYGF